MERLVDVLLAVGISKGAATIALATGLLLGLGQVGFLPAPLHDYLAAIWIAFVLSASFLVLDLGARLVKWGRSKVAPEPSTADRIMFGAYANLDPEEKRVLRVFVERHLMTVYLKDLGRTEADLEPVHRLAQRNFLYLPEVFRMEGQKVELDRNHFRNLVEHPNLVGSKAPPRSFG